MKYPLITKKKITSHFGVILAILLALLLGILFVEGRHAGRLETEYEKWSEQTHLVQTMRSELLASAEAEKSAVMADTDESSRAFAEQSEQASQNVEKARLALTALLEKNSREAKLLDQFSTAWEKLRDMDRQILLLAVQNTNLKALRLSTGPAAARLEQMQAALDKLMDWAAQPSTNKARVVQLCAQAMTNSLNLHALETPHIFEATDTGMELLEARMKPLDATVRQALNLLDVLVRGGSAKPWIAEARQAFEQFQTLHNEVLELSHQNTNVRSMEESLGQKRRLMILCLSQLDALQEAVKERATTKASR